MRSFILVLGACLALLPALFVAEHAAAEPKETAPVHALGTTHGRTEGIPNAAAQKVTRPNANGISYHGGPVMTGATNAYVIWYGNWTGNTGTSIIPAFLASVGGSPYYNVNTTYTDAAGVKVKNQVVFAGQTTDSYSQGAVNLSDAAIGTVVSRAVTTGGLPSDPNGVYFVLTSKDVTKTGFLSQYCGWHTYQTIGAANVKYSFVGDPTGPNLASCSAQQASSPNANPGVDAMVSVIAHELEEAVTDPNLNAWFDQRGYENADKCAWTFGTTYTTGNGSKANMNLGGKDYLVQRNWLNANGGLCVLGY